MISQRLQLTIETMVFNGFSSIQEEQLKKSIADVLSDLIEKNGLPSHLEQSCTLALHDDLVLEVEADASVDEISQQIAEVIYSGDKN
jgi:hypothetical protein